MFKVNKEKFRIFLIIVLAIMGLAIVKVNARPSWGRSHDYPGSKLCSIGEIDRALETHCRYRNGPRNLLSKDDKIVSKVLNGMDIIKFCCSEGCDGKFLNQFCMT